MWCRDTGEFNLSFALEGNRFGPVLSRSNALCRPSIGEAVTDGTVVSG